MSSKRSKHRSRRRRPKKQPKFMSLNTHIVPPPPPPPEAAAEPEENDPQVACLLEDGDQPSCMPTITDLFAPSAASSPSVEALSPASPSAEWDGGDGLARRALKGRERWVFCRDEIHHHHNHHHQHQMGLLQLKLDYDVVLTAWSGRAPPYIDGDGPQVVPELQPHHNMFVEVGNGGGWRVPEMAAAAAAAAEGGEEKGMKREERVMRYKAKRQSRLFSKRVRYQVRKLNAEKRPRIKGRFVKRVDDM